MMKDMQWKQPIDTTTRMNGMIIPRVCTARMDYYSLTMTIDGHRLRMMRLTLLHLTASSPWWSSLLATNNGHVAFAFSRNEDTTGTRSEKKFPGEEKSIRGI
jgi:hypothetical protein